MNHQEVASDSFNSGFGSSFNSMQSIVWGYANHVVNAAQQQKKPLMHDEDGWFTCSEHSDGDDEQEIPLSRDATDYSIGDDADDEDYDMKQYTSNRQKRQFKLRFQRQASTSSANESKERATSTKTQAKTKGVGTKSTIKSENKHNKESTSSGTMGTEVIVIIEPDQDERRNIRRLALARMKSEEMWGSSLESDSEESQLQEKEAMSSRTPSKRKKMFRKKSYTNEYDESLSPMRMKNHKEPSQRKKIKDKELYNAAQESGSEGSSSPSCLFQEILDIEMNKTTATKRNKASKPREMMQASSPTRLHDQSKTQTPQQQNVMERPKSAPKIRKQTSGVVMDAMHKSQRGRSTSPIKTNGHLKLSDQHNSKPKAHESNVEKKYNKYEMIPTGSIRQNRSTAKVPVNDHVNYSMPIQSDLVKEKITITSNNTLPIGDSIQRRKPVPPSKARSIRGQSSFTEKKKTSQKLDESLFILSRHEDVAEKETESTIPICEKLRHAVSPPVPNREYSSHSSMSSSSTTLPSPISEVSTSYGSGLTQYNKYKVRNSNNTGHIKKTSTNKIKEMKYSEADENRNLDNIMESRRFRNCNLELQKKTKQYLAAVKHERR